MTLKYNLTRKEFDLLADAIYDAKSPAPVQWTYGRGFSFVIQLVTTIGKLWLEILKRVRVASQSVEITLH